MIYKAKRVKGKCMKAGKKEDPRARAWREADEKYEAAEKSERAKMVAKGLLPKYPWKGAFKRGHLGWLCKYFDGRHVQVGIIVEVDLGELTILVMGAKRRYRDYVVDRSDVHYIEPCKGLEKAVSEIRAYEIAPSR